MHVSLWIFYLLLSCILATKPVKGICGVSWTIGGGGGGATDTGAATPREAADRAAKRHKSGGQEGKRKVCRCKKRCKRNREGIKENKKLVSERNSARSFAEQFMYTCPISLLLCCVFQGGLKRCSSRLCLRIDLISICFKSEAMARSGLVQR